MSMLLQRYPQLHSRDPVQVRQYVAQVLCAHRLSVDASRQPLDTHLFYRQGERVGFGRLRYGTDVAIEPETLEAFYLLQVPIRGQEEIRLGPARFVSSSRTASIISPGQPFAMHHGATADKLFVRVERQALEAHFRQHTGRAHRGVIAFDPSIRFDTPAGMALWRLLRWQFFEASEGVMLDTPGTAKALEDTLLTALCELQAHNQDHADPRLRMAPTAVRRALQYIDAHAAEPLSVAQVAQQVGVSTRSLYAGFRDSLGQSPMAYLKTMRLQRVRAALQQADPAVTSVTALALGGGFGHLGQFAADYRAEFGELPSETLHGRRTARR